MFKVLCLFLIISVGAFPKTENIICSPASYCSEGYYCCLQTLASCCPIHMECCAGGLYCCGKNLEERQIPATNATRSMM